VKRVTDRKLLAASRALLALAECDDAADVFHAYREEVIERMVETAGGYYQNDILGAERDMPHSIDLIRLANHLAVIAVPDVD
jgi:hypothetical protein